MISAEMLAYMSHINTPEGREVITFIALSSLIFISLFKWKVVFTHVWLYHCAVALILNNPLCKALVFVQGVGIVGGWYTVLACDPGLFKSLFPFWRCCLPIQLSDEKLQWLIITGDLILHPLPVLLLVLSGLPPISLSHILISYILTRLYHLIISHRLYADADTLNAVYLFDPPAKTKAFHLAFIAEAIAMAGLLFSFTPSSSRWAEKSDAVQALSRIASSFIGILVIYFSVTAPETRPIRVTSPLSRNTKPQLNRRASLPAPPSTSMPACPKPQPSTLTRICTRLVEFDGFIDTNSSSTSNIINAR